MKIDLNMRVIPEDMNVWVIHAGQQKKFLKHFISTNKVFIDFPGLDFTTKNLPKDEDEIFTAIYESQRVKRSYRGVQSSLQNALYVPKTIPKSQRTMLSYIKRFYLDIKIGDMIVSPPRRQYDSLLVGHVTGDVTRQSSIKINDYINHRLPARDISREHTTVSRRNLDPQLAIRMENRQAIIRLTAKDHLRSLFDELYGSYIWGDQSKIDIRCQAYRGKNPLELIPVQELLTFANAIYSQYELGNISDLKGKSFQTIIHEYFDEDFIEDIAQKFQSPGFYRQWSKKKTLTYLIPIIFCLGTTGNFTKAGISNLEIINSAQPTTLDEKKELKEILQAVSESVVPSTQKELTEKAQKAKEELKISTTAKVK